MSIRPSELMEDARLLIKRGRKDLALEKILEAKRIFLKLLEKFSSDEEKKTKIETKLAELENLKKLCSLEKGA